MSAPARAATVGVLPALGSGLADLARTGQHERLLGYDLRHYARAFDEVVYFSYGTDEALSDFTRDPEILARVRVVPRRGPWPKHLYALLLPWIHRRAIRRCGVLRVMQFTGVIPALLARALYGIPFAVTYGYDYAEVARLTGSRVKPWLLGRLERLALPRAAGVIVTSGDMRDRLAQHPARPRLALFPNGVDTAQFAPAERRVGRAWRQVLYAGRLEPEKNVGRLIEALSRLSGPPVRLVVVGDGRLRSALAAQARQAGVAVDFAGVVAHGHMPRYFADADCFALPSLTEGHPKALIEAMASGVPCAASARGGIPSMLQDGVTGLLFDPEDPAAIARAIGRLLDDAPLAARLAEGARAEALARYDARALLDREASFVRSLARGSAPVSDSRAAASTAATSAVADPARAGPTAADRIAIDPAPAGATAAAPATARSEAAGAAATWRRAPESTAGGARRPGGIGVASTLPVSWAERGRAASEAGRALADAYAEAVPMDEVVPDFVAERLRPLARRPPRAVLDLGAGDGRYLAFFGRLFPEGTLLVGAELSLVRARRLAAAGFRAVVAEAEALPFRAAAFDLVTLMEVIEHTRAPGRALDEGGRVLAPGGRLVLTTPNYPMKRVFDARAALRQRRLERLWDDPTHISPLTAGRLERLLAPRFGRVELEGTALPGEGLWPWLASFRRSRAGRRLSNKLFAVCGHGGVADG